MAIKSKVQSNHEFNPIYKLALSNAFPDKDVNSLLEVCYNTPKVEIAIEMLLGIYELPQLKEIVVNSKNGRILTMTNVDKFENRVNCSYQKNKTETFYFEKGIDVETLNHENYLEFKQTYSSNKELISHTITFPEMVTGYDYFSIKEWMSFDEHIED